MGNFDDVLIGFKEKVQKLYKKRESQRWQITDAVIIDIKGQLLPTKLIDASAKVVRLEMQMPLSLQENCTIIFKENPSIQLVGMPVITDVELRQGYWNRVSLRVALDLNKFKMLG